MTYLSKDPVITLPSGAQGVVLRALNFDEDSLFYFSGEGQDGHVVGGKLTSVHDVARGMDREPCYASGSVLYAKQRALSNGRKMIDLSDAAITTGADGFVIQPEGIDALTGVTIGCIYDTLVQPASVNQDIISFFENNGTPSAEPILTLQARTTGIGFAVKNWDANNGAFASLYSANNGGGSAPGLKAVMASYNAATGAVKIRKDAGSYTEGTNTNLGTGTLYAKATGFEARIGSRTGQAGNRYGGLIRDLVVVPHYLTYDDGADGSFLWNSLILPELAACKAA